MPKYTITIPHSDRRLILEVSSGICVASDTTIDWSVGLSFEHVRKYCERKGWKIVPQAAETSVTHFEFQGYAYDVTWLGSRLRITRDEEEISWQELPEQLKVLL